MGRESLLTHTHGAEVTAGAALVGKNRALYQKTTWKLWLKLTKRELIRDKDGSSSLPSALVSVAVKGIPPSSLTLHLSPCIYYLLLFSAHLRGSVPPLTDKWISEPILGWRPPWGYRWPKTGRTEPKAVPPAGCGTVGVRGGGVRSPCTPTSSLGSSALQEKFCPDFCCCAQRWGLPGLLFKASREYWEPG